jgi:hypothetical protein
MSNQEKSLAVQQIEENRAKAKLYEELKNSNATNVALCYMGAYLVELHSVFGKKDEASAEKKLSASIASKHAKIVQGHCDLSQNKKSYEASSIKTSADASVQMKSGLSILELLQEEHEKAELYEGLKKNITKVDAALCAMASTISEIASLHAQTLEQMITPPHAKLVRTACNMTQTVDASAEKVVAVADHGNTASSDSQLVGEDADQEED